MIEPVRFLEKLESLGVRLFTGVPDSLLRGLCSHLDELPKNRHIVGANEGAAVGLAIGHYLRTGRPALVYLQNSGIGNAINPLLSLADEDVYGIPMILLVGWRGKVGVKDEPQHLKQGRVMEALLDSMELPWVVLPRNDLDEVERCLHDAIETAVSRKCPYVIMVEKGTFTTTSRKETAGDDDGRPSREEALQCLIRALGEHTINISTTGMLSRELFEHREQAGRGGSCDFLTVGGMGHCSSIALGIALREREREVWCLDGDGALLMHMGTMTTIAKHAPASFFHVVFNNGVHDSVGGQPTSIDVMNIPKLAEHAGYRLALATSALDEIEQHVATMRDRGGPALLELKVRPGNRSDIGRPTRTPKSSKREFMAALGIFEG